MPHTTKQSDYKATSVKLEFWIKFSSWSYCKQCNSVQCKQLQHTFTKTPVTKPVHTYPCQANQYTIPMESKFPDVLKKLTSLDILMLTLLDLHCGDYIRMQHGYRENSGILREIWSRESVTEKIQHRDDQNAKDRYTRAYNYLMNSEVIVPDTSQKTSRYTCTTPTKFEE